MSNAEFLKNVPDVNSEEFKKKMYDLGYFDSPSFEEEAQNLIDNQFVKAFTESFDAKQNEPEKKNTTLFSKVKNWAKENKDLLVCGTFVIGSFIILCKTSEIITTNSIFKANVKTIEHLANNYILVRGGFDE